MADRSTEAWNRVGDRFGAWSRMLAERYRRRAETGEESSAEERRLEDALRAATHQVDVALSSLGDTLRDPEAKQTLREAIRALGDALSVTFSEVGEQIRTHLGTGGPPKPPGS